MEYNTYKRERRLFHLYTNRFKGYDHEIQQNIDVKHDHILRVSRIIRKIALNIGLNTEQVRLAVCIGLFHDIGRFMQYTVYNTFSDSNSENHSAIALQVLKENGFLKGLSGNEIDIVNHAVSNHNRPAIPEDTKGDVLLYSKLIRDADKLDIFRILISYYNNPGWVGENETIRLGLPDKPEISEHVFNQVMSGKTVKLENLRTVSDFKIFQAAWVYDIHFQYTLNQIIKHDYINRLLDTLPQIKETELIRGKLLYFLNLK